MNQLEKIKSNFDNPNCEMCGFRLDGSCTLSIIGGCCSKTRNVVFPIPMFAHYGKDQEPKYCITQNLEQLEKEFLGNILIYRDMWFCEQYLPKAILISHIIVSGASITLSGYEIKTNYTEELKSNMLGAVINSDVFQTLLKGEVYKDKKYLQYYKLIKLDVSYDDFKAYGDELCKPE